MPSQAEEKEKRRIRYFAGVDGGATKTVCLISDELGSLRGYGVSGPSNCHNVGLEKGLREISNAVENARRSAGIRREQELHFACFGLAGIDSPLDEKRLGRGIGSLRLANQNKIVHDTVIALTGALGGEPGVAVIAGTGSVAGGVDSAGRVVRVGGWGAILGDEGSAYDIGRKALTLALRAYDGRGKPTRLLKALMTRVGTTVPEGLIEAVYIKRIGVDGIASLSRVVVDLASQGDEVSNDILTGAGESLAGLAVATAKKLGLKGVFKISPVGGVFGNEGLVIDVFKRELQRSAPLAKVVPPKFPPVIGSLILSLRGGGVRVPQSTLTRMASQLKRRRRRRSETVAL